MMKYQNSRVKTIKPYIYWEKSRKKQKIFKRYFSFFVTCYVLYYIFNNNKHPISPISSFRHFGWNFEVKHIFLFYGILYYVWGFVKSYLFISIFAFKSRDLFVLFLFVPEFGKSIDCFKFFSFKIVFLPSCSRL